MGRFRELPLVPPRYRGNDPLPDVSSPGEFVVGASGELHFGCPDGTFINLSVKDDVDGLVKDDVVAKETTWSSQKISDEIYAGGEAARALLPFLVTVQETTPIGTVWTDRAVMDANWVAVSTYNDVRSGSKGFVALSNRGQIMISQDGISWSMIDMSHFNLPRNNWNDIAVGMYGCIAVGDNGQCMASEGGDWWFAMEMPKSATGATQRWEAITYYYDEGGIDYETFDWIPPIHRWIALSYDGAVAVAENEWGHTYGLKFEMVNEPIGGASNVWYDVACNDKGVCVSTGLSGRNMYSDTTSRNWTVNPNISTNIFGVTWGNGLFVAGTTVGNRFAITSDGITWTASNDAGGTGSPRRTPGITFGDGLFVAVGYVNDGVSGVAVIQTSPNGTDWTRYTPGKSVQLRDVAYAKIGGVGRFVAIGHTDVGAVTSGVTTKLEQIVNALK